MGTWSAATAPSSTSSTDWHSAVATTAASLSCRVTWRCFSAGTTTGALTGATGSAARLPPRSSPTLRIGVTQHDEEFFGGAPSVNTSRWLDTLDEQMRGYGPWWASWDRIEPADVRRLKPKAATWASLAVLSMA